MDNANPQILKTIPNRKNFFITSLFLAILLIIIFLTPKDAMITNIETCSCSKLYVPNSNGLKVLAILMLVKMNKNWVKAFDIVKTEKFFSILLFEVSCLSDIMIGFVQVNFGL